MQNLTSKGKAAAEATSDRRKAKRHRPRARVSWRVLGDRDARYGPAELKDVSSGGVALLVNRFCKAGTPVVVQLEGVGEAEPILLRAQWSTQQSASKWLMGCSFSSPLTEQELQAFLLAAEKGAAQPVASEDRPKPTAVDPFVVGSARERRAAARRSGRAVPVLLVRAQGGTRVEGFVADRSLTGLGILLRVPFPRGTELTVQPRTAGEKVPAVKVQVRSCRQKGNQWVLGCQFLNSPPSNVLLFFG